MQYSNKSENINFSEDVDRDRKFDQLRAIERQFGWKGDDWHFALVPHMAEPIHVYAWFRFAKRVGEKIYFNGANDGGKIAYDWAKKNAIGNLLKAFGKVEIVLAKDGDVIKSFNPLEKEAA